MKFHVFDTLRIIARDHSTHPRIFMSAAIVRGNKILATGANRMDKTSSFQARFAKNPESIFPHAEVEAIKNFLKVYSIDYLNRCDLYVCRIKYDCTFKNKFIDGNAQPCTGCVRAINTFEIKNVFYTTDSGYEQL